MENLIPENIRDEFHPRSLLPSLAAGLVTGVIAVTVSTAFAALIFSGDLSMYIPAGIGFMLFASMVIAGLAALTSSLPGLVSSIQDTAAVILAIVSAAIAREMLATATPHETFLTVVAAISLASFLTGASFLLLGQFKLGNLIRFIPYPVIGGFLAGTGLLLVLGAVSVMIDMPVSLTALSPAVQPELLIKWLPGLCFGAILLVILRRSNQFWIVPGMLLAAIAAFYALLIVTQTSISDATAQGWLLGPLSTGGGGLWHPPKLSDLGQINLPVLFGQMGNLIVIALVSAISILLNATGIELATGEDVDLNHELKATGFSNLVAGLGGGMVGYHALSDTALVHRMGAKNRLLGLILAAVCGCVLLAGGSLLMLFPKFVLGGLLLFLGLDFLVTWIYDAWFKLPLAEYFIVILIMVIINTVGFLEGVGLGVVLAVVLFVANYSRINVVKHVLSGANYRSHVERPRDDHRLLRKKGHLIYILELHGFIFFGTANTLLHQMRQRIDNPAMVTPRFILLDFRLVNNLDSSAVLSFAKMLQTAAKRNIILVVTQVSPAIQRLMERELFSEQNNPSWRVFPDMDRGIEWCEDQIIKMSEGEQDGLKRKSLMMQLERALPPSIGFADLEKYLERKDVDQGYFLIRKGDPPGGIYFIEAGEVTVQLKHEDGKVSRLRKLGVGTVVGEMGLYLGQQASASVITEKPSTLYLLSADNLARMEAESPEIASVLHRFIARILGERLLHTDESLHALLE